MHRKVLLSSFSPILNNPEFNTNYYSDTSRLSQLLSTCAARVKSVKDMFVCTEVLLIRISDDVFVEIFHCVMMLSAEVVNNEQQLNAKGPVSSACRPVELWHSDTFPSGLQFFVCFCFTAH